MTLICVKMSGPSAEIDDFTKEEFDAYVEERFEALLERWQTIGADVYWSQR